MWWFRKSERPLWIADAEGREHITEEGGRKFDQWEAEGKIQCVGCQVHILDPLYVTQRVETWPIGDDGEHIDRETYNRLKDERGHLHALVHYKAGRPELYVVAKPFWDQALESFK